jgi:hypothetical protein
MNDAQVISVCQMNIYDKVTVKLLSIIYERKALTGAMGLGW